MSHSKLKQVENWLNAKQGKSFHYKMEKFQAALDLANHPEHDFPSIHIAGTNGKGSTIAFLQQLYQAHGLRVGAFVSPHVISYHDRVTINDQPISVEDFVTIALEIQELEAKLRQNFEPLSYFETMTLVMFYYFSRAKLDIALIEVGIGGLHDVTNVIQPLLSIITSIGLDHQDMLGETLGQIAAQKAGIIKAGTPVVLGPLDTESQAVIQAIARENSAPIYAYRQDFNWTKQGFKNPNYSLAELRLGLEGLHQQENAALALEAFLLSQDFLSFTAQEEQIRNALAQTSWAGRLEIVSTHPLIYLDGAHNVPAIKRLIEFIKEKEDQKITILFSALARKDFQEMLHLLKMELPKVRIMVTSFAYDGAISDSLSPKQTFIPDYKSFLRDFQATASQEEILVVTGSLYFISEVRYYFLSNH